jgi:hypothetical protein
MLDFFAVTLVRRAVAEQFEAAPERPAPRRRRLRRLLQRRSR